MKKLFVSILLVIYTFTSVGATMHFHYCMDKFVGLSFQNSKDNKCHNCGMEKQRGCCKDNKAIIKLGVDQNKAEFSKNTISSNLKICTPVFKITEERLISNILFYSVELTSKPTFLPQLLRPSFLLVFRI